MSAILLRQQSLAQAPYHTILLQVFQKLRALAYLLYESSYAQLFVSKLKELLYSRSFKRVLKFLAFYVGACLLFESVKHYFVIKHQ